MSFGILAVLWTVRVAMAYYAIAVAAFLLRRMELARWAWTAGAVFFVGHVIAAFEVVHHWSHLAALTETARQTLAMTGFNSGFGLWLNYLFAVIWMADAAMMWLAPRRHASRPRSLVWLLHGFLLFMVINGTIVFAHGPTRVVSLVTLGGLLLLCLSSRHRRGNGPPRNPGL